jgi:hypothetical protein
VSRPRLVDANLLLYAHDELSDRHAASREWFEDAIADGQVRFAWTTIWAFLRISTNSRASAHPLTIAQAMDIVDGWLAQPSAGILEPGERHATILAGLLRDGQITGPLVMDAALAAIAIEHGATLCTTDRDFSRFLNLDWTNPIA